MQKNSESVLKDELHELSQGRSWMTTEFKIGMSFVTVMIKEVLYNSSTAKIEMKRIKIER